MDAIICDRCGAVLRRALGACHVLRETLTNGTWREYHLCGPCFAKVFPERLVPADDPSELNR